MKGEYTKKLDHSINQSCMNVIKSRGGGGVSLHDPVMAPKNGVTMEILRRIKPQAIPLLPADRCTAIAIHVGLHSPLPPLNVP